MARKNKKSKKTKKTEAESSSPAADAAPELPPDLPSEDESASDSAEPAAAPPAATEEAKPGAEPSGKADSEAVIDERKQERQLLRQESVADSLRDSDDLDAELAERKAKREARRKQLEQEEAEAEARREARKTARDAARQEREAEPESKPTPKVVQPSSVGSKSPEAERAVQPSVEDAQTPIDPMMLSVSARLALFEQKAKAGQPLVGAGRTAPPVSRESEGSLGRNAGRTASAAVLREGDGSLGRNAGRTASAVFRPASAATPATTAPASTPNPPEALQVVPVKAILAALQQREAEAREQEATIRGERVQKTGRKWGGKEQKFDFSDNKASPSDDAEGNNDTQPDTHVKTNEAPQMDKVETASTPKDDQSGVPSGEKDRPKKKGKRSTKSIKDSPDSPPASPPALPAATPTLKKRDSGFFTLRGKKTKKPKKDAFEITRNDEDEPAQLKKSPSFDTQLKKSPSEGNDQKKSKKDKKSKNSEIEIGRVDDVVEAAPLSASDPLANDNKPKKTLLTKLKDEGESKKAGRTKKRSNTVGATTPGAAPLDIVSIDKPPVQQHARSASIGGSGGSAPNLAISAIGSHSPVRAYRDKTPRLQALRELIETEKDYIRDLGVINNVFIEPITKVKLLEPADIKGVFANAAMLYRIHMGMLKQFDVAEEDSIEELMFGQIFLKLAPFLMTYTEYCLANETQNQVIADLKARKPEFAHLLKEAHKNNTACRQLDLESFLIKPVQRICKYPLLIRELLKHTAEDHADRANLVKLQATIEGIVSEVNKRRKQKDNAERISELHDSVESWDCEEFEIVLPSRMYLRDGNVQMVINKAGKTVSGHIYLFNDCIIFLRPRKATKAKRTWSVVGKVELRAPRSVVVDSHNLQQEAKNQKPGTLRKSAFRENSDEVSFRRPSVKRTLNAKDNSILKNMLDIRSTNKGERFRFVFSENMETRSAAAGIEVIQARNVKKAKVPVNEIRDDWLKAIEGVIVSQWGEPEASDEEDTNTADIGEMDFSDEDEDGEDSAKKRQTVRADDQEELSSFSVGDKKGTIRRKKSLLGEKKDGDQ